MTVVLAKAYNNTTAISGTSTQTTTFSSAIAAGSGIIVMIAYSWATSFASEQAITSVADTANGAYTLVGSAANVASDWQRMAVYKFENSAAASANANTLTITWANHTNVDFPGHNLYVCTGCDTANIVDLYKTGATTSGTTPATTTSGSTGRAGELGLCYAYVDNDSTGNGTGWTGITGANPDGIGGYSEQQTIASAGTSVTGTVAINSGGYVISMVTIQPAAAAASSDIVAMTGGGRNPRNSTYLRMRRSRRSGLYVPNQERLSL